MGLILAALCTFGDKGGPDLRYEDVRIIAERNIFSPAKPKKKEEPRKEEKPKEERKAKSAMPLVTGFEGYPDGFRVLVHDATKGASVRYGIGELLGEGTVVHVDNTHAVIRGSSGTLELRAGDPVPGAVSGGEAAVELDSDEVRERMKKRIQKQVEEEPAEEESPRLKKKGGRK